MSEPKNHLSLSTSTIDRVKILDRFFDDEVANSSFKNYMNLSRFSVALERKLVNDMKSFNNIRKNIDISKLNWKQRLLLELPAPILRFSKKIQNLLLRKSIYLSSFR